MIKRRKRREGVAAKDDEAEDDLDEGREARG